MKTLVAIAVACLATAAQAEPSGDTRTLRVGYSDLDVRRASGRAVLEQRVRAAIERVCPARPAPPQLGRYRQYRTCKAVTWEGVQPQLAEIYGGRRLAEAAVQVSAGDGH